MMLPTIHLNGTSYARLMADTVVTIDALRDTMAKHAAMTPHGRDYYPQGPRALEIALREHGSTRELLAGALLDLEQFAAALAEKAP